MLTSSQRRKAAPSKVGGVAAVDRALSVLLAFGPGDSHLSLGDLAARTGLYKSTLLRLLVSLEAAQFITRTADGHFRLDASVLNLATIYERSFNLREFVEPELQDLMAKTAESASYYIRDGNQRLCLFRVDSKQTVRDQLSIGERLPLNRGAAGRAFLLYEHGKPSLSASCDVIQSLGERDPEMASIAAPVFGKNGALIGVLSIAGPRSRLFLKLKKPETSDLLTQAAQRLSMRLREYDAQLLGRKSHTK
ncbi:IclR family transcriptional regulator [Afipia sp. P52-10]|uniref:IclR family transcriptional regulator n=1 Tax=Afipia sp. P52-10 TaxID=1429916 RepID=UPI0003DF2B45|nr:IclR family transcriptional regulator [Afipia sp. P52-10]ETR78698.1 IclR family transcriptional regulator [Afipia sp. P52-10]